MAHNVRKHDITEEHLELALDYEARWRELGDVVPQIAGLACHVGVASATLYDWSKQDGPLQRVFSEVLARVMDAQHRSLVNGGVSGDHNHVIAKLILTSKHGYTERSQVDNVSSDESMSPKRVTITLGGRRLDDDLDA